MANVSGQTPTHVTRLPPTTSGTRQYINDYLRPILLGLLTRMRRRLRNVQHGIQMSKDGRMAVPSFSLLW